jgi:membrane fusion protein, adhesin transport system
MELAQLESEEAQALAELSRMGVRLSRQEQQMITAPVDGVVVSVLKTSAAGVEYVRAGDPLAVIVPETSSRVVEIWISGNDMPWVRLGDKVAVQFDGWPAVFFSGVPGVSVGTFFGKVHLIDALDDGNGRFRVLVKPEKRDNWPESLYLKQGVRARGWVLLGDVPFIYELWRKFNGFPPERLPNYQLKNKELQKSQESK